MKALDFDSMVLIEGGNCEFGAGVAAGSIIAMAGFTLLFSPLAMVAGLAIMYSGSAYGFYKCVIQE
jgi:hypothetical protein